MHRSIRLCLTLGSFVCLFGYTATLRADPPEPPPAGSVSGSPAETTARAVPQPNAAGAAVDAMIEGREVTSGQGLDPTQVHTPVVDAGPIERGFILGAGFGLKLSVGGASGLQSALQPGLALGGKIGRAYLTIGAEFINQSSNQGLANRAGPNTTVSQSITSFLVVPGLQVALVRSRDGRVELLGAARVGIGTTLAPSIASTFETSRVNFMFEVGPGVRYWAHRHFALSLTTGFRGDYLFQSTNGNFNNDPTITSVVVNGADGVNGIFAALGGMGAF